MLIRNILLTLIVGGAMATAAWRHAPPPWTPAQDAGLVLTVLAFPLWTLARFQLGSSFSITAQARQLVTRGLYARIRNPIYCFGSLAIAGFILLMGQPKWLLIFVVIIPLQIARARKESRILEAKFGEAYRTYRAATWF